MHPHELIAKGWEDISHRALGEAETHFRNALEADPTSVDAHNGLGAIAFEGGDLKSSLAHYRAARAAAAKAYGGTLPKTIPWIDEHKPALRALHGIALNQFRMGELDEAKEAFEDLLARNPEDNQGVHFMLADIKKKRDLWKDKS